MTKTLAKLLKEKNLLVARVAELKQRIQRENVIEGDNKAKYDNAMVYAELHQAIDELIKTKTLISTLNVQVVDKIYRLGELKAQIQFLRTINTQEGTVKQGWGEDRVELVYKPQFDKVFVDAEVERLTKQITQLQDELDTFNYTAKVDVE